MLISRRIAISLLVILGFVATLTGLGDRTAIGLTSFADGFESGTLSAWTTSSGLAVQTAVVASGNHAARSTGSVAWASKTLGSPTGDVEVALAFRFGSRQSPVWLTRLRTASNANLVRIFVNKRGRIVYRNHVANVTRRSTTSVSNLAWHHLRVIVTVAGASSHVRVVLDGSSVPGLDRVESLGTVPVGKVEIGNRPTGKVFDLAMDDVLVEDQSATTDPLPPTALSIESATAAGVVLSWSPPPAGPAPTSYRIYRDNALVGVVGAAANSFTDAAATGRTRYLWSVESVTAGGSSEPTAYAISEHAQFGSADAVVYAAGDIVCKPGSSTTVNACRHGQTAEVVSAGAADAVLALGDLQYEIGRPSDYQNAYAPTWGLAKSITLPAVGNHEYKCDLQSEGCAYPGQGYFGYFGAAAGDPDEGWYRNQVAGWTVLSLNSNCKPGTAFDLTDCDASSPQYQWVQQQLATAEECSVAIFHHPRFSSGDEHGSSPWMQDMWALLAGGDVDLVLWGHEHMYERFAPADAAGGASVDGTRSFTVGAGGKDHAPSGPPLGLSRHVIDDAFGVLKLTLHDGGYDYSFVPAWGDGGADEGTGSCH